MDDYSDLASAIVTLQSQSSAIEDRINSLRFVKLFIDNPSNDFDRFAKSKLSQLILDSVLSIIMSEDRTVDIRKRQLIRTECFLLMANILESKNLYGNVAKKLHEINIENQEYLASEEYSRFSASQRIESDSITRDFPFENSRTVTQGRSITFNSTEIKMNDTDFKLTSKSSTHMYHSSSHAKLTYKNSSEFNYTTYNQTSDNRPKTSFISQEFYDNDNTNIPIPIDDNRGQKHSFQSQHKQNLSPPKRRKSSSNHQSRNNNVSTSIFKTVLEKSPPKALTRKKFLRPRTSVIYGDQIPPESSIVPGVSPSNWQQQDRLLGYSKSKTWYPTVPKIPPRSLLPQTRPGLMQTYESDDILEEYLQMRAMLSYLGDQVLPQRNISTATGFPRGSEEKYVDTSGYDAAVHEAVRYWTPLVGSHIPIPATSSTRRRGGRARTATGTTGTTDTTTAVSSRIRTASPHPYSQSSAAIMSLETYSSGSIANTNSNIDDGLLPYFTNISNNNNNNNHAMISSPSLSSSLSRPLTSFIPDNDYNYNSNSNTSTSTSNYTSSTPLSPSAAKAFTMKMIDETVAMKLQKPLAPADRVNTPSSDMVRSVVFTKGVLRRLLRKELFCKQQTKETLRNTLDELSSQNKIKAVTVSKHQDKIKSSLQAEHDSVTASALVLQTLMRETIKLQYATLPSRYVLVVEGNHKNSRKVIGKALEIFCRIKSKNLFIVAFGIWKIRLIASKSEEKRPLYAKFASVHLMNIWFINIKIKKLRTWINRWRITVSKLIFSERNISSLLIQTLSRRWRDRRKLISLHEIAPYNGPLSDIYLAPYRSHVMYTIPYNIRATRRMYWLASIVIQKYFRRMKLWKDYKEQRRRIVLLQSVLRMLPKRIQYLRLKATAIKCQSWMRRTLLQRRYISLKGATIIIQMYVRRYLAILKKLHLLDMKWNGIEQRMASAIRIQCKWRRVRAVRKIKQINLKRERIEWAALKIQHQWYHFKRAFHTFLLMCCYRIRDTEDRQFDKDIMNKRRYYSSRNIQNEYRKHYFKRIISAVIRVQCWFRGRLGYTLVAILRLEKWAARKLHHWARARMRFKHVCAHKIAHLWLKRSKKGRLLQHLQLRAQIQDSIEDSKVREERYQAASRIQANVKGIWIRRWVRRHKAALVIQRPLKFFLARRRWLHQIKERLLQVCRVVVDNILSKAVAKRTRILVKLHSKMLISIQRIYRGYIIRIKLYRARLYAFKFGLSVVRVQRFWRDSGAFIKAVQEVIALKRMDKNPFKDSYLLHHLLRHLYKFTTPYAHGIDPRIGMKISTFLYRIGMIDLYYIFPKKEFRYVTDLRRLTMDNMITLFNNWQQNKSDKDKTKDHNSSTSITSTSRGLLSRSSAAPKTLFKEILSYLLPPIATTDLKELKQLQNLYALPEIHTTISFYGYFIDVFSKKYGKTYASRAENLAKYFMDEVWTDHNNFKSLGKVVTPAQITRAIALCNGPADVKTTVEMLSSQFVEMVDERSWDENRYAECASLLQLAVERAKAILPPGIIFQKVETASIKIANYKRRFTFRTSRRNNNNNNDYNNSNNNQGNSSRRSSRAIITPPPPNTNNNTAMSTTSNTTTDMKQQQQRGSSGRKMSNPWVRKESQASLAMTATDSIAHLDFLPSRHTVYESVNKPFMGTKDDILLEMNVSICKIYFHLFEQLNIATHGINALKSIYRNKILQRTLAQEKLSKFLLEMKEKYVHERHTDHVKVTWNRFKHNEIIKKKMLVIEETRKARHLTIKDKLQYVVKHGWNQVLDKDGYHIWAESTSSKRTHHQLQPQLQVDMPTYSLRAWDATIVLQKRLRKFAAVMAERRRIKAELTARQIEIARKVFEEKLRLGMKHVTLTLSVEEEDIVTKYTSIHTNKTIKSQTQLQSQKPSGNTNSNSSSPSVISKNSSSNTPMIGNGTGIGTGTGTSIAIGGGGGGVRSPPRTPVEHKMNRMPSFRGLKRMESFKGSKDKDSTIQDAAITMSLPYHLHFENCQLVSDIKNGTLCDIRTSTNDYQRNVSTKRIVHVRLAVGSQVEARYKAQSVFYKGVITSVHNSPKGCLYTVLYEDGEKEFDVPRYYIRSTAEAIETFFYQRKQAIIQAIQYKKRKAYFDQMKNERLARYTTELDDKGNEFESHWSDMRLASRGAGRALENLLRTAKELQRLPFTCKLHLKQTRLPLRYPWQRIKALENGKITYSFYNPLTLEYILEPPLYSGKEDFFASKIQSIWSVFIAKKNFKKELFSQSIDIIANKVIERYQKFAFIGYKIEGATCQFILRRAGYSDIAEKFDDLSLKKPALFKTLKIDQLIKYPVEKFNTLGVSTDTDIKRLKSFQEWWTKTPEDKREEALSFINYYNEPYDLRDLQTCINESQNVLYERLSRAFSKNIARVNAMDSIGELVNKQTLSNWKEERDVYLDFRIASRRIGILLANMGVEGLSRQVREVEDWADSTVRLISKTEKRTTQSSGLEAKAAWMIRRDVLELVLRSQHAASIIQTRLRGLVLRYKWMKLLRRRKLMAVTIERVYRGSRCRKEAAALRLQQSSYWEQLWDDRHNVFYYFNIYTKESTYDEPTVPYRPLVRHMRSAVLIQSWPFLDEDPAYGRVSPTTMATTTGPGSIPPHLLCDVCSLRRAVRVCIDCPLNTEPLDSTAMTTSSYYYSPPKKESKLHTSFCFVCFTKNHSNDIEKRTHNYKNITDELAQFAPPEDTYLRCIECEEPATRKCLGILDEKQIDDLCMKLHRASPSEWMDILHQSSVGGEKKLALLISNFQLLDKSAEENIHKIPITLTNNQLQSIRSALERTRAECDECYCIHCYKDVHAAGKRASHKWIGFQAYCSICSVCTKSPAEMQCGDCADSVFCSSCYKVFHSKGRKRKHTHTTLVEVHTEYESTCGLCNRRVGTDVCNRCGFMGCDSCFTCYHKPSCDAEDEAIEAEIDTQKLCVLCNEPADQKCVQCGDLYCSRTWMGNPGCFAKFHHKGNRLNHTTEPLPPVTMSTKGKRMKHVTSTSMRKQMGKGGVGTAGSSGGGVSQKSVSIRSTVRK
eukprot:gene3129-6155_t